ncbi:hypothetical protein OX284_012875 [Flavobacterium sp. SUN046]|uniref:hypothetical protein n=1 Tax=Flavobacterium sp. SUN046 TaxID=3002440 RepID=UPI002DBFC671|nr:hypothetical protein [Flavobacterium sp. SUN046]MEC4050329.1 hypothetical protein [Flavobacterium sp. SUN046]
MQEARRKILRLEERGKKQEARSKKQDIAVRGKMQEARRKILRLEERCKKQEERYYVRRKEDRIWRIDGRGILRINE